LKSIRPGIENSLILFPSLSDKENSLDRRLNLLSFIDIFQILPLMSIVLLLDSLVEEHYEPDEKVIEEGSIGNKFYIVENGIGKIFSNSTENT